VNDDGTVGSEAGSLLGQTGGFGIRAGARVLDWVFHAVIGFVAGAASGLIAAVLAASGAIGSDWQAHVNDGGLAWNIVAGSSAAVIYEILAEGIAGTTLGKLVLGLRVVTTNLTPCTLGKATIRGLAYYVDSFFFGAVAYSSMSGSELNQRLGDKWADTLVVRAEAVPESARRSTGTMVMGLGLASVVYGLIIFASSLLRML